MRIFLYINSHNLLLQWEKKSIVMVFCIGATIIIFCRGGLQWNSNGGEKKMTGGNNWTGATPAFPQNTQAAAPMVCNTHLCPA